MSKNKKETSAGTKTTKKRVASLETPEKMPPPLAKSSAQASVFHISGLITQRNTKKGIPGLRIEAIDKDLHIDQPLGSGTTDAKGYYDISISPRKIGKRETAGPDIVVRAFDQKDGLLGESKLFRNAPAELTVNFSVLFQAQPTISEYDKLLTALLPVLMEVPLVDLQDKDIKLLAKKLDIPKISIETMRTAARNASSLFASPVLIYALLRKDLGGGAIELAQHTSKKMLAAVNQAVAEGIIPEVDKGAIERLLAMVEYKRAENVPISRVLEGVKVKGVSKVLASLADQDIHSLGELKSPAGFDALTRLDREQPGSAVDLLRAHVNMSLLVPDIKLRSALIDINYHTVGDVVSDTITEFIKATKDRLDPAMAMTVHTQAVLMNRFIKKHVLEAQLKNANTPSVLNHFLNGLSSCSCQDCESAVSPLAYLADLLKYCYDNLRDESGRIDYLRLGVELHQKFASLPTACGELEKQVHQVRIAIEVLRSYLATHAPSANAAATLALAERAYLRNTYENLLLRIGISYADLRLAVVAPDDAQAAVADRIGIRSPAGGVNLLRELLLDLSGTVLAPLEAKIEELFGLKNTRTDPLAAPPVPKLLSWRHDRLKDIWFQQDWPNDSIEATVAIIDPDVIGPDDFRDPIATRGAFEIWIRRRGWVDQQLEHLLQLVPPRSTSRLDTMLKAMYAASGPLALPRYPLRGGRSVSVHKWPSAIQKNQFLSLSSILGSGNNSAVENVRNTLHRDFGLEIDAYNHLLTLYERDTAHHVDARNPALLETEVREFISILVQARKQLHVNDWLNEEQSAQRDTNPNVIFQFGAKDFWISLTEPEIGDWPPMNPDLRTPWIDPDLVKLTDLPDSAIGNAARSLWDARKDELFLKRTDIAVARRQSFARALSNAFGAATPNPFATWGELLDDTLQKLGSNIQTEVASAKDTLDQTLYLTDEAFRRMMAIRAKDANAGTNPNQRPTVAEYDEIDLILLGAHKRKTLYPTWRRNESSGATALSDWEALKIRLPQWRAQIETRADWQSALRRRAQPPVIDPDLIDKTHLVYLISMIPAASPAAGATRGELAARLWTIRKPELAARFAAIKTARIQAEAAGDADKGLSAAFAAADLAIGDLNDLRALVASGRGITKRLIQICLDAEAFHYLSRINDLIIAQQNVEEKEWTEVYSILLETWKRRNVLSWREAEREAGITLSPDCFKFPEPDSIQFPPPLPPEPTRWRANLESRRSWEDRLQARIDQIASIEQGLAQAVDAVEEIVLPQLRDVLIQASQNSGLSLVQKTKWLEDRLLINLRSGGCAKTTRVAQAIETIQILLFSIRTGLLLDTYPKWKLTGPANAVFDNIWLWLGSFTTWRAAMFVLLYPQNLLVPNLRREKTPEFKKLLQEIRSGGNLSGQTAKQITTPFVDYLRDICQLDIAASPNVSSLFFDEGKAFPAFVSTSVRFLFGLSASSRRLYWSIVYREPRGEIQSSWKLFSQFKKSVTKVLGARTYKMHGTEKQHLYVFVTTNEDNKDEIYFVRLDLQGEGRWLPAADATQLDTNSKTHFKATLLGTQETEPPAILVMPIGEPPFKKQLGEDGTATNAQIVQATWGETYAFGLLPYESRICGGMALRKNSTDSSHDLVIFGLSDYGAIHSRLYGNMMTIQGIDSSGSFESFEFWDIIDWEVGTGSNKQNKIFGDGDFPFSCAIAIADVNGDGKEDLIIVYTSSPLSNRPSKVFCRLGLELEEHGKAKKWITSNIDSPMLIDAMENTGPIAVAFLKRTTAGSFDLVVAGAGGSDRKSIWLRKMSLTLTNGEIQLIETKPYNAILPSDHKITGIGLAFVDLEGNGNLGLLMHYSEETGPNTVSGWLRYAPSIDLDGFPTGQWRDSISVESRLFQKVEGSSFVYPPRGVPVDESSFVYPQSAGLVVGSLSNTPGRIDAVIATFPGTTYSPGTTTLPPPPQQYHFQYLVANNIDLQFVNNSDVGQFINTSRYKPYLVAPLVPGSFDYEIGPNQTTAVNFKSVSDANINKTRINQVLLEEAFVFGPLAIALELQRSGNYLAALDWFRSVFDYTAPKDSRVLYPGLEPNPGGSRVWRDSEWNWLQDPLDPHSIAQGRNDTYRRYVLQAIIRCHLDFADAEFAMDTSESIPRARILYQTALELLEDDILKQKFLGCDEMIDQITLIIGDLAEPTVSDRIRELIASGKYRQGFTRIELERMLNQMQNARDIGFITADDEAVILDTAAKAAARTPSASRTLEQAFSEQSKLEIKLTQAVMSDQEKVIEMAGANVVVADSLKNMFSGISKNESNSLRFGTSVFEENAGVMELPVIPGGGFTDFPEIDPNFFDSFPGLDPSDLITFPIPIDLINPPIGIELNFPPHPTISPGSITPSIPSLLSITACVGPNPVLRALRLRAELNLYKINTCRSITGERRQVEPYAAPTASQTGLPSIGTGGQLVLPQLAALSPTPYRYSTLIERAKSLAQLAQHSESAMFDAMKLSDADRYTIHKARQDLENAKANVQLQTLRVHEAGSSIDLAELHQDRAQLQIDQYSEWLNAGLNSNEQAALVAMALSVSHNVAAAAAYFANYMVPQSYIQGISAMGQADSGMASIFQTIASQERRHQEWTFQRSLAQQDLRITAQERYIAEDRLRVVTQEQTIASLNETHASAIIEFLAGKFLNTDLLDWMVEVLSGVYRYYLQQATGMARLAVSQLAFERHEVPPPFIHTDYWTSGSDDSIATNENRAPDRRGLTGSARLLQDITQLDQYAFTTDRRELQLSKTISLLQIAPFEFQQFRETGVLTFATPLEMFEADFPGNYRCLVRRVKVSVVALIPPSVGIRATLLANRISRVVIGGELFQTVRVSRDQEMVALSSPRDATGLFELDTQPAMLAPFEKIGVDTTWEFRLPRASNPFNFDSIADILFTIEYTALHSFEYQQQVLQKLSNRRVSARRGWTFRNEFADQWYDLNNPERTTTPMTVRFSTLETDFPPNIVTDSLTINDVALYFVRKNGARFELPMVRLRLQESGSIGFVGGTAGTLEGIIFASSGAAGSWTTMQGKMPIGDWELFLPNNEETINRFFNEEIVDILFVVTYSGRTPPWPN